MAQCEIVFALSVEVGAVCRQRCTARDVFLWSVVVGTAVPAAVYPWGLCPRCLGVGRCLGNKQITILDAGVDPKKKEKQKRRRRGRKREETVEEEEES